MGVIITETPHRNLQKTSHFTVNLLGNDDVHTISTTLTTHPGTVRNWLHSVLHSHRPHLHRLVIGLGVQWTPYDHPSAATLQLCVGRRCLIYHLHHSRSSTASSPTAGSPSSAYGTPATPACSGTRRTGWRWRRGCRWMCGVMWWMRTAGV
ncbi:hypothetical protein RND81_05G112400 [Saponaria officinalis]|uniref:Flavin reductase like domain-containing protein n=1 Tax=Saponaria officinalis TaxID=3572 RepID=A0AAW1KUM5_SAPOF